MADYTIRVHIDHDDPWADGTPRISIQPDGLQYLPPGVNEILLKLINLALMQGTADSQTHRRYSPEPSESSTSRV